MRKSFQNQNKRRKDDIGTLPFKKYDNNQQRFMYKEQIKHQPLKKVKIYEMNLNQLRMRRQKQFNEYHTTKIHKNQLKFDIAYRNILYSLNDEVKQLVSEKYQLTVGNCQSEQKRQQYKWLQNSIQMSKWEQKTMENSSSKIINRLSSSKSLFQSPKLKTSTSYKNRNINLSSIRKNNEEEGMSEKPLSCRTFIMELQELIQQ